MTKGLLTLDMDDVVVKVVGQQWLRQLTQKTLHNGCWDVNVIQPIKIHRNACNISHNISSYDKTKSKPFVSNTVTATTTTDDIINA